MSVTLEEVVRLIENQMGKRGIRPEDGIVEDLGAESMDVVNIVAAVEDRFSVGIGEREIPSIRTAADLHRLIIRKTL